MQNSRGVATGPPDDLTLEQKAIESTKEPVNRRGEKIQNKPRTNILKENFIERQFPGGPKLESFKGVRAPSKKEVAAAESFTRFRSKREAEAKKLMDARRFPAGTKVNGKPVGGRFLPKGSVIQANKTGALQVKLKGRIVANLKPAFRDPETGRFSRPKSPKATVVDEDAFRSSVRAKAEQESLDFFTRKPTGKQIGAAEDAIFDALGV